MRKTSRGLLIVNADDLGYDPRATDATHECWSAGRITSSSAMVYMEDSDRAAELFRDTSLGVGLHLNVSEAFRDPNTPQGVRERQERLVRRFGPDSRRQIMRWVHDPTIQDDVDRSIADQLERFEALYGRPPTHFDGHQHVHVCPNVFLTRALPGLSAMRSTLDRYPSDRSGRGRLRALRQHLIDRRFLTADYLFDIADVDPQRSRFGQAKVRLDLAWTASVEILCHPGFDHEYETLTSSRWEEALRGRPLGSFADLTDQRREPAYSQR